jgi:pimeloyl-ACP methyl ester carboxylesterase
MTPTRSVTQPLTPPPLPPGRTVVLPGRGETFVRILDGPPDQPPVLLLHGWMATADINWFSAFTAFEGKRTVIALDHRGHGRGILPIGDVTLEDCADDAAALLEVLGIPAAVVVGYSLGVAVSLLLARRHPEKVAGLVLSGGASNWTGLGRLLLIRRAGWDGTFIRMTRGRPMAPWFARRLLKAQPQMAPYVGWLMAELERGHPGSLRAIGRSLAAFDARPWLDELGVATAFVVTEQDHLVRPKRQRALAQSLRATTVGIRADHDAPAQRADLFVPALLGAVDQVSPSRLTVSAAT